MKARNGRKFVGFGRRLGGGVSLRQVGSYASGLASRYGPALLRGAARAYAARSSTGGSAITTQHDMSTRYNRRPGPRRRRKRWVRFTRRVNHVIMQQQHLQSITFDDIGGVVNWLADQQFTDGCLLGGTNAGVQSNELLRMFQSKFGVSGTQPGQVGIPARRLFVKAMCLDLQFTNTGATGCIIDVYQLVARKNYNGTTVVGTVGQESIAGVPLQSQYNESFAEQGSMTIGTVDSTNPSTTPFQNSPFCSIWKIVKKTQVLLGSGQVTTMQFRNPRNRMIDGKQLEQHPSQIPGYTTGYLFQFRGVPQVGVGDQPRLSAGSIAWRGQKTVTFGVPPGFTTQDQTAQQ